MEINLKRKYFQDIPPFKERFRI